MARGFPDFQGNKVGVYLQPEWAAKEGVDKSFTASNPDAIFGEAASTTYLVPSDKTLYITSFSGQGYATVAASGDLNQIVRGYVINVTDSIYWAYGGGNGGFAISFPIPIVIAAGKIVRVVIESRANHEIAIRVIAQSYEV